MQSQVETQIVEIAKRAKSYVRMLVFINVAAKSGNGYAKVWWDTHAEAIQTFIEELKKPRVEGEELTVPEPIRITFDNLPYGKKLKEAETAYMQYYEAWEFSHNLGVMLARLKATNPKHGLTQEEQQDEKKVLVALCDALSGFSATVKKLESNKWYIA